MITLSIKEDIQSSLQEFSNGSLRDNACSLLNTLGYRSEKTFNLPSNDGETFLAEFDPQGQLNKERALFEHWRSIDLLFQLAADDISLSTQEQFTFHGGRVDDTIIESYLFFAIELQEPSYTRTQLAGITREINRLFPMPVMLVFRYGDSLTLAIINRRLHKRDESKDVLEKVTLIKDIAFADPLRAHIEILYDLSLPTLHTKFKFHNFVGLHKAWEQCLDTSELNKLFYRDIANWYFWVLDHPDVIPPRDIKTDEQRSIFTIRLITRLIFCWFLQEKNLIPRDLFRPHTVRELLKDFSDEVGTYYKAILQNLFFATLNQEISKRKFRSKNTSGGRDGNRGVTTLFRYRPAFRNDTAFTKMLKRVPFINGGLFDCLDEVFRNREKKLNVRLDDFSEEKGNELCLPNELFFGEERQVDLSEVYQDKRKRKEKVRGIIEILNHYKFTVEENTPLEQEIALDPELLGKVFENLLASYNPDTRTTARKATGSFYTPREVVNYMVDESLMTYLAGQLQTKGKQAQTENKLRQLFSASANEFENPFSNRQTKALIEAIDNVKILDPACGSGAFPMGALHRLVDLLNKLDPNNRRWKEQQLERARQDRELAEQMQDEVNRENALEDIETRIKDIERSFDSKFHELDFARKLYLIENCIYGVDIQPIACQIAKLRFFIALIVDQKVDLEANNLGVRPLPNLETKIVAADALIPIERLDQHQFDLFDEQIRQLRENLEQVRHEHFNARSPEKKARCREKDTTLRKQIAETLQESGLPAPTARALADWAPYDQNRAATFFDPAWMFSIKEGFNVVIGNPPYVRQEQIKELKPQFKEHYDCYTGTADLYVYFYERSIQLLKLGGAFSFISSNKWFRSAYGEKLRGWLTKHTRVLEVIDFGDAPVFTAIAYPCIVVLTKEDHAAHRTTKNGTSANEARVFNWQLGPPVEQFVEIFERQHFCLPQTSLKPDGWRLESPAKLKLLDRIRATGTPLGKYVEGRFYYGIKTGLNEAFVIDRTTRDRLIEEHPSSEKIIKPFLRGKDVKRWRVEPQDLWLIFTRRGIDIKKYPAILEHLRPLKKRLMPGVPGGRKPGSYKWYEIQDNIAYWREFEQPKIIFSRFVDRPSFAYDREGYFVNNALWLIPRVKPHVAAVINSQVGWWFLRQNATDLQNGFYQIFKENLSPLGIPILSHIQEKIINLISDSLLYLSRGSKLDVTNETNSVLLCSYLEQLLNGLVYELFFPEELHEQKLFLFRYVEEAKLPVLAEIPEAKRLSVLQETFEQIYDLNHPVRGCLFSLRALEIVRIIEDEA